jgi:formylglycine-generating enzyme required for sulfatase activity
VGARPPHEVTLRSALFVMRTEVTVAQYRKQADAESWALPPGPDFDPEWNLAAHPMVNVTWNEAAAYCAAVGGRLPSEDEWEGAARGGHPTWRYPWGFDLPPLLNGAPQANVADEALATKTGLASTDRVPGFVDGFRHTAPVARFEANEYGLFDVVGNAAEWCAGGRPAARIIRGGSWGHPARLLRLDHAATMAGDARDPRVGLRCVRDAAP